MVCDCNKDKIELLVKQGTTQSFKLIIRDKEGNPVDLLGCVIAVDIKKYPLLKVESLYSSSLTTVYTPDGYISDQSNGEVTVTINENITNNFNPGIYYMVIQLIRGDEKVIISGEGTQSGILRICNQ